MLNVYFNNLITFNLVLFKLLDTTTVDRLRFRKIQDDADIGFPWAGLLRVHEAHFQKDSVTGIVMIHRRVAVGNADAVTKINKETMEMSTTAIFYFKSVPFYCKVLNYIVHPEYASTTANTLALVTLDLKRRIPTFLHTTVSLPLSVYVGSDNIYTIGFIEKGDEFEQITIEMQRYERSQCERFYKNDGLDFKYVWPTSFSCYRDPNTDRECVYDAGMALATNESGKWTLIGISTFGPGCSLPSRFVEIYPYVTWIKDNLPTRKTEKKVQEKDLIITATSHIELVDEVQESIRYLDNLSVNSRRVYNMNENSTKPGLRYERFDKSYIPQGKYDDRDTVLLKYATNDSLIMYRDNAGEIETIYTSKDKECRKDSWTILIYRESGWFKMDRRGGIVFLSVSLHDFRVNHITCIKSLIKCQKKSKTEVEFHSGLNQEDIHKFIKKVEVPTPDDRFGKSQPYIKFLKDTLWRRKWYDLTTIYFRFYFYELAEIEVVFYGMSVYNPEQPAYLPGGQRNTPTTRRRRTTVATTTQRKPQTFHWRRGYTPHVRGHLPPKHGGHVIGRFD